MQLTVTSPNTSDNKVHVHQAGCADLRRYPKGELWTADFVSLEEAVEEIWADQIAEAYDPERMLKMCAEDTRFFPCVR